MKNYLKLRSARTILLATTLVLTGLLYPLSANAANKNVWIYDPVDTQAGAQSMTVCVGADVLFSAQTSYPQESSFSWSGATKITEVYPTSQAGKAFDELGNFTVTATYNGETSYAANVTVRCPTETLITGEVAYCDSTYGATFIYCWDCLAGRWIKEHVTSGQPDTCQPGANIDQTTTPGQASGDCVYDDITNSNGPPTTDCQHVTNQTIYIGPTEQTVELCTYSHTQTISVVTSGNSTTVTTSVNGNSISCYR